MWDKKIVVLKQFLHLFVYKLSEMHKTFTIAFACSHIIYYYAFSKVRIIETSLPLTDHYIFEILIQTFCLQ